VTSAHGETPGALKPRTAGEVDLETLLVVSHVCGRIAHDLNNLLAAVDGYAEFVAQDVAGLPQALADITEVRSAAGKGAAFARRLRQVGQLEEISPERLDLSTLVAEAQEQVTGAAGESVRVELALPADLPVVEADRQQVQLALLGLVENACEAMAGAGTLRLETFTTGAEVALRVGDTGTGMPDEVQDRVFEPFFSTKLKAIGNGLGLFIVAGVVARARGRVELVSQPGAGTSVTLLFPRA
jgi:signal transduction histidine kinase